MNEYPTNSRNFEINNKQHIVKMLTLKQLVDIENKHLEVTIKEVVQSCTDMKDYDIAKLSKEQIKNIYNIIIKMTEAVNGKSKQKSKKSNKTTLHLIAWLMNKGHKDAQFYRLDFATTVINEMIEDSKRVNNGK